MKTEATLFLADQWAEDQYALLDSGDGHKLERFGSQTVIRPDPQAFWSPASPIESWTADARFDAKAGDDDRGNWQLMNRAAPEAWPMEWRGLHLNARRTPFRHSLCGKGASRLAAFGCCDGLVHAFGDEGLEGHGVDGFAPVIALPEIAAEAGVTGYSF